jgi:hypothetical protein
MTVFRWIIGVFFGLLAGGWLLCLGVYLSTGMDLWGDRARKFRQFATTLGLFWFNIEIWGRVVYTIVTWR